MIRSRRAASETSTAGTGTSSRAEEQPSVGASVGGVGFCELVRPSPSKVKANAGNKMIFFPKPLPPPYPPPPAASAAAPPKHLNPKQKRRLLLLLQLLAALPLLLFLIICCTDPRYENQKPAIAGTTSYPRWTASKVALQNAKQIQGHVFLITGAYGGIGQETAKALYKQGGQLIVTGRSQSKLQAFVQELENMSNNSNNSKGGTVIGWTMDLADLASVKSFAHQVLDKYNNQQGQQRLTIINNAAIICPVAITKQGLEMQMGVNVVGHFLLNKLLLPITKRQVWVSSTAHYLDGGPRIMLDYYKEFALSKDSATYDFWRAYQQSKLANILIAKEFSIRYNSHTTTTSLETASLHPGVVWTNAGKDIYGNADDDGGVLWSWIGPIWDSLMEITWLVGTEGWWFLKTPQEGAATTLTVATMSSADVQWHNGGYYKDSALHNPSLPAQNLQDAKELFDWCESVTKNFQS